MPPRRIAVITDSAANLPPEVAAEHGIHVIPLRLIWGEEVFREGVDLTPSQFYARLRSDDGLPTTSTFSTHELRQLCQELSEDHQAIVAVLLAHELSGSVATARTVQQLDPGLPLHVIDTRTATMAEGFVALEAARAAAAGTRIEEVIHRAEEVVNRVHMLAALETFEYLRRGGRVGAASAFHTE